MALNPVVGSDTVARSAIMLYNVMGSFWIVLERLERLECLGSIEPMAEEKNPVVSIVCGLEPQLKTPSDFNSLRLGGTAKKHLQGRSH